MTGHEITFWLSRESPVVLPFIDWKARVTHELAGRSGADSLILNEFRFQDEERRRRFVNPGTDQHRTSRSDRMAEPNVQFAGNAGMPVREEAVRHCAVQEHRDDSTVYHARVSLEERLAIHDRLDAAIIARGEIEPEAERVIAPTNDAAAVRLV